MKLYAKYITVALSVFLAGSLAAPLGQAQARLITSVMDLNSDGGYLGIEMKEVTADNMSKYKLKSEQGVIVSSVVKGSPAESAKLQEDDVILEFAKNQVWSTQQFSRLVRETPAGRSVELGVSRDGKRMNLAVQIGKRETEGSRRSGNQMDSRSWVLPAPMDRFFGEGLPENPGGMAIPRMEGKPRLGVTLQPLTDQLGEYFGVPGKKGALVSSVASGSPSAGKLKSGDVITEADGNPVNDPEDLARVIRNKADGAINLKVIRDKKEITIAVDLPSEENQKGYKL
jgi:serine protease Do